MITTKEVSLTKDILEEIRIIDLEVYKNVSQNVNKSRPPITDIMLLI